jgi:hypothetical protein
MPWVDGGTRRALINLPPSVTQVTVPPEFLLPDSAYEFESAGRPLAGSDLARVDRRPGKATPRP